MICQDCEKTILTSNDVGYYGPYNLITTNDGFVDENTYRIHLCVKCYYDKLDKEEKHDRHS